MKRHLPSYSLSTLKSDFLSGIVVFLVAIPLCLGISLASGAPIFSGIISGVVGGIIVGIFSGSSVSVSGPAAGMAAVVLSSIAHFQDFKIFLLVLCIAGLLQIAIGSLRAGFLAEYIPSNVVQGLLCAIGVLLILKQLPVAFTHAGSFTELKNNLLETTERLTIEPLYQIHKHLNLGASLITIISLLIMFYLNNDKLKFKFDKVVPAPVMIVILGVILNDIFLKYAPRLAQTSVHLVNIPHLHGFQDLVRILQHPDLSAINNIDVYAYAILIALVASLESLLNVKASEKIDTKKRFVSKNRELIAQGIGNFFSGMLGGIPITSVIVRTSVNVQSGNKTKMATILHGCFLLFAVILIPHILNMIPISSLASILIYTGYKLTQPKIYKNFYDQGLDRFVPFIATVLSIVIFNLLLGVIIGLIISLFFILKINSTLRFDIISEKHPHGEINRLILPQNISFLNKGALITELDTIKPGTNLIIDASNSIYIDKEIIELLHEFKDETSMQRNISLNLVGFKDEYQIHDHIDFIQVTTYDVQSQLTPKNVLELLKEGNQRFVSDQRIQRNPKLDVKQSAKDQHPIAVVLGCIDSRVPVETIFDMGFGDLFIVRIAGNVVNQDILASIEYATHFVGAKLVVILGHTQCGAIAAACEDLKAGHLTQLLNKIKPAIRAEQKTNTQSSKVLFVDNVTSYNIAHTIAEILKNSTLVNDKIASKELEIVGAIYNVESGKVIFKDFAKQITEFL